MMDAVTAAYGPRFGATRSNDVGPANTQAAPSVQTGLPGKMGDPVLAWVVLIGLAAAFGLFSVSVRVG